MGVPGQEGRAQAVVWEWAGSQGDVTGSMKQARWLEQKVHFGKQKEGDVERELRIRTQRIQTLG